MTDEDTEADVPSWYWPWIMALLMSSRPVEEPEGFPELDDFV